MSRTTRLLREWPLAFGSVTTLVFLLHGSSWMQDLSNPWWLGAMFAWPFLAMLLSAFGLVRHAEAVAHIVGEPLGTLVLTLAVTGLEAMVIAAMMYTGPAESAVARDTMFAVIMIALNGLVGLCMLLGGLRYREQTLNLYGANSFLAVIVPLASLGLILPAFTSAPGGSSSTLHSVFLIFVSIGLYAIFLVLQTRWHRDYFVLPNAGQAHEDAAHHGLSELYSSTAHVLLMLCYLVPVLALSKQLAKPIDYGIAALAAPPALSGLIVAILILSPETMAAIRAARANQLQRSINLALGSVLASISLTIPAVLTIGFVADKTVILGLAPTDMVLLLTSLAVSILTFALERTNVLLGAVHVLLFLSYLLLLFE